MKTKIQCPFCKNEQYIHIYDVIKPGDKRVKEIENAHLTFFKCSECGQITPIINNFIYLDEEKKFVIVHKNNDKQDIDLTGFEKENYEIRITSNIYEMREKIIAFNNNLNDKFLELMKILYKYKVEDEIKIDWVKSMYIEENDGIKISLILGGDAKRQYDFNQEIYDQMEKHCKELLGDCNKKEEVVNYQWAVDKIRNFEK